MSDSWSLHPRTILTEVGTGLPYHLGRLVGKSLYLFLVVHPPEEQAVVAKLREQSGHLPGMAERVDLPADVRPAALAKRVVQLSDETKS